MEGWAGYKKKRGWVSLNRRAESRALAAAAEAHLEGSAGQDVPSLALTWKKVALGILTASVAPDACFFFTDTPCGGRFIGERERSRLLLILLGYDLVPPGGGGGVLTKAPSGPSHCLSAGSDLDKLGSGGAFCLPAPRKSREAGLGGSICASAWAKPGRVHKHDDVGRTPRTQSGGAFFESERVAARDSTAKRASQLYSASAAWLMDGPFAPDPFARVLGGGGGGEPGRGTEEKGGGGWVPFDWK